MNPILASLLNIGSRGIPQFIKGRFQTGGAIPGGFRTNPFRGPKRTVPRAGREEPFVKGKPWRDPKGRFGRRPMGPPKPTMGYDKGGYLYRHPTQALLGATGLVGYGGLKAYDLLTGDDKPDEETTGPSRADLMRKREQAENDALAAKQPSMSAGHRTDYLKKRKKRLQKGMKQLLNQYMILSAVSPEQADNFLKAGMSMMEKDQEFNDDLQIQDAYDMVFQPGNMPTSGRDAFAKLLPYVGKKDAMAIAGDWSDLVPEHKEWQYKKKETMAMEDILRMPRGQAIEKLISMWASDTFTTPEPLQMIDLRSPEGQKAWAEYADATLDLMQSGGGGATSSGQILSDTKRS